MACAHHPSPAPAASWRPRWKSFLLSLFLQLRRWLLFLPGLNSFLLPSPATVKTKNIKNTSSSAGAPTNTTDTTTDTSSCSCTAMETAARLAATGKQPGGNVVKGPDGKDVIIENSFMAPPEDVAYHKKYMRAALDMAEKALSTCNEVPVGCVFVHNDEIIGRGMNDTNRSLCGTRHAEFIAIEHILLTYPPSIFAHTDLYVTVEPCIMCASALRQLHIRRVFFGCMNERFGGTGGVLKVNEDLAVINEPSYQVYGGINHDEAIMLLRRFYIQENDKAPQPIAKKTRKLKLEVAPFAGENKLKGVGEGTGGTPVVSPIDNTTATKIALSGESKPAEKAEESVGGMQKEQTIAHEEEKKIEIEEVKEILEDDTKHNGGMACNTAVAAA